MSFSEKLVFTLMFLGKYEGGCCSTTFIFIKLAFVSGLVPFLFSVFPTPNASFFLSIVKHFGYKFSLSSLGFSL